MASKRKSTSSKSESRALSSTRRRPKDDVFIDWLGTYQQSLFLGRFVFIAFSCSETSADAINPVFFDKAKLLASRPNSLPDPSDVTVAMKENDPPYVCAGWYDTVADNGGWAAIMVVPSTSSDNDLGSIAISNDGTQENQDGWFTFHWTADNGQAIYLHYADGGDPSSPQLRFGIMTTAPS